MKIGKENLERNALHQDAIELARDWAAFASFYHEPVFVEDIHLFGAIEIPKLRRRTAGTRYQEGGR